MTLSRGSGLRGVIASSPARRGHWRLWRRRKVRWQVLLERNLPAGAEDCRKPDTYSRSRDAAGASGSGSGTPVALLRRIPLGILAAMDLFREGAG